MIVRWIGVDCHVATTTVAILNEDETKARHRRFNNTEEAWVAFCRDEVDATTHLVLEASAGIWPVYDRLVSAGAAEVLVAHPLRVKAIAAARVKTDRVDARTLALLGRGGLIPAVWVPSPQERLLRGGSAWRERPPRRRIKPMRCFAARGFESQTTRSGRLPANTGSLSKSCR